MQQVIGLLAIMCFSILPAYAADDSDKPFQVEKVAEGLGIPWGMAFLSENKLLVTQREGLLSILDITSGSLTRIKGTPEVKAEGQGGLLDVALAPDYQDNGWIYFTYTKDLDGQGATTLARAQLKDNRLINWQDLLVTRSRTNTGLHYGSRIVFDHQGHVFFGIGDRGKREMAQDLQRHNGKILRLNLDGSIPQDNPFIDDDKALPEIWSYGHRNPHGLFYNVETDELWEIEHGPRGGDEINLIQAGNNYGWPEASHGKEYRLPMAVGETEVAGMTNPIKVYVPSIAPSGLIQYQGEAFAEWRGDLFTGALVLQHLNHIKMDGDNVVDEKRYLENAKKRIRNVVESPEGWLYLSTDDGEILRLKPRSDQ